MSQQTMQHSKQLYSVIRMSW